MRQYCLPRHRFFFFFNDTATTEIYTLSLHDALPIFPCQHVGRGLPPPTRFRDCGTCPESARLLRLRSEEHTSELQSQSNLVCRLLLEKKKSTAPQPAPTRQRILSPLPADPPLTTRAP